MDLCLLLWRPHAPFSLSLLSEMITICVFTIFFVISAAGAFFPVNIVSNRQMYRSSCLYIFVYKWISEVFSQIPKNKFRKQIVFWWYVEVIQPFSIFHSARSLLTFCCPHLLFHRSSFWTSCGPSCAGPLLGKALMGRALLGWANLYLWQDYSKPRSLNLFWFLRAPFVQSCTNSLCRFV